ncbi:MAG: DUF3667 domain-containing protein [Chitinophagaceae bacterium]|nr:DUF3667 domain-containing protein [Chitinophagaceae bacterium]
MQPNNRITIKRLIHEAWHTITHVEEGFWRTIIDLAIRPGKMIREYVRGHRKPYQKPFPFLFILTTLYALIIYWLHFSEGGHHSEDITADFHSRFISNARYLEAKYYSWLHIGLLPFYGLISMVLFRQLKYNWAEWMVACCYIISFILILLIPYQIANKFLDFSNAANFYIQFIIISGYSIIVTYELVPGRIRSLVVLQTFLWCLSIFALFLYTVQGIAWLVTTK